MVAGGAIEIAEGRTLTVTGGGTLIFRSTPDSYVPITPVKGNLTVDGATVTVTGGSGGTGVDGSLTVNSGRVTVTGGNDGGGRGV